MSHFTAFEYVGEEEISDFYMKRTCKFSRNFSRDQHSVVQIPKDFLPSARIAECVLDVTLRGGQVVKGVVADTLGNIIGIKSNDGAQIEPNNIIRNSSIIVEVNFSHHYPCVRQKRE